MQQNKKQPPLYKKHFGKKALELPPLCAFDFETYGLYGYFIIGCFITIDGLKAYVYSEQEALDWILEHPGYRYLAHNASGYEFCYLMLYLQRFFEENTDIDIIPTIQGDSKFIQLRIYKAGKLWIDLRDTLCLFGCSLEKVAESFCPDIPKLKKLINFEKENFDINNPDHIKYVDRDCEIVLEAYVKLAAQMREVFNSPLKVTSGSTAIHAYYTTIPEGHCYWRLNERCELFCREGYYGGLVLPGKKLGEWGEVMGVDVNGAYAFQMRDNYFPIRAGIETSFYHPGYIGFYRVRANVPPSVFEKFGFNPIPQRTKNGLVWSTGKFETVISSIEIEFAQTMGCTFEVLHGYYWLECEQVFKPFVEKCQQMELAENGKFKPTVKLNRNACYGKFGSKTKHKKFVFSHELLIDNNHIMITNRETGDLFYGLYTTDEETESPFIMPHWAGLITAYERVYLMKFVKIAYEMGATNVYCDTDSIKGDTVVLRKMINDGIIPMGDIYGQFKIDGDYTRFIVLGPKCYYGEERKGKKHVKAKGVPTRRVNKRHFILAEHGRHRPISFTSGPNIVEILRTQLGPHPTKPSRKITNLRNSFSWEVDSNNNIFPYNYLATKKEQEKEYGYI